MIRHPNWPLHYDRRLQREELVRLRDLRDRVLEYGGWDTLLTDIEGMEKEIDDVSPVS